MASSVGKPSDGSDSMEVKISALLLYKILLHTAINTPDPFRG